MLQDQIAGDEIERPIFTGPGPRDIGQDEIDMVGSPLRYGLIQHGCREVQSAYMLADLGQQGSIFAGPAADFQDGFEAQIG